MHARDIILGRYPHLAQVPRDALNGLDTPLPWIDLGNLISTNLLKLIEGEEGKQVGQQMELGDIKTTWHDVTLSIAELMQKIRLEIFWKLGYTISSVCLDS